MHFDPTLSPFVLVKGLGNSGCLIGQRPARSGTGDPRRSRSLAICFPRLIIDSAGVLALMPSIIVLQLRHMLFRGARF